MKHLKTGAGIAVVAGVALFAALIVWQGTGEVWASVRGLGAGLALVPVWFVVPLAFGALSWRILFPPASRPAWGPTTLGTWIGFAVNWLLPVAQIGGDIAKAHWVTRRGAPAVEATASTVVDKTVQVATQVAYTLMGAVVFAVTVSGGRVLAAVGAVTAVFVLAIGGFYIVQRRGLFRIGTKLIERFLSAEHSGKLQATGERIDAAVHATYTRRRRLAWSFLWRMAFRFGLMMEIAFFLHLMGRDTSLGEALILSSLGQAARAAAFVIPGGLGAREGALMLIGVPLGLSGPEALTLSLAERFRELLVGIPALLFWHFTYGLSFFFRRDKDAPGTREDAPETADTRN